MKYLYNNGCYVIDYTNDVWLLWDNQFLLQYLYDTIGTGGIDSTLWENTGYRKDSKHLYIHPPRSFGLEILQYAPFSVVYFDETITFWKDTFTISENSGWGEDLDNSIFYQDFQVVKHNKKEIIVKANSIRGVDTSSIIYVYDFKKGFTSMDFVILDSLEVHIEQK